MSTRGRLGLIAVLPLYFAIATALGFLDGRVRAYPEIAYDKYVPGVIAGTEEPPGRYRVLAPYLYEGVRRVTGMANEDAWRLFRWLCLFGSLIAMHVYLRTWFDTGAAAAGTVMSAALLPLTFTNSWGHPDHFVELGLFALGCAAIARGAHAAFFVLLLLNALNRETAAFLVLLLFCAAPLTRAHLVRTAIAGAIWAAVYVGLRQWLGWVAYDPWQLSRNLEFLRGLPPGRDLYYRYFAWFTLGLIIPAAALMAPTWPAQPRFMRAAAAIVVPAYLVVAMLFSSVIETRIFTMLIPLLVPGMVAALFPRTGTTLS